jgi:hypothetical protein
VVPLSLVDAFELDGYLVVKGFFPTDCFSGDLCDFLKFAPNFSDGVITSIPDRHFESIRQRIQAVIPSLVSSLELDIATDRFSYCAIRVQNAVSTPLLRRPFNFHQDPKVAPGGVLNWHLDHYSYYLNRDHTNWLICYVPIFKPSRHLSNLAIVPTDVIKQHDPHLHQQIEGRGAMRFRCAEPDTLEWFKLRFPDQSIKVGDWFAIDDYDDASPGFKLNIDLEAHKVVPELEVGDLLIMRADVIHRTNDAGSDRISVRCDAIPSNAPRLDTWRGLVWLSLQYPFMGAKRKYNVGKWLRNEWAQRLK